MLGGLRERATAGADSASVAASEPASVSRRVNLEKGRVGLVICYPVC